MRGWGLVGLRVRDGTGTVPYGDIVNPICRGDPLWSPAVKFIFEKSPEQGGFSFLRIGE